MGFPTLVKTLIQIPQRHCSRLPRNCRNHRFRRRPRHRHRHPLPLGAACFSSSSDAVSRVAASPLFSPYPLFLSISISASLISRIAITLAIDRVPLRTRVPFRRNRAWNLCDRRIDLPVFDLAYRSRIYRILSRDCGSRRSLTVATRRSCDSSFAFFASKKNFPIDRSLIFRECLLCRRKRISS